MNRPLITAIVIALTISGASRSESVEFAGRRPNVILIMTDDQGYGDLACHGNPHIKTPQLDRLHRESLRLTNFHVSPTCAPTRAALLTGRHEFASGVTHTIQERERLALAAVTLPEMLKSAGYVTGIFGKWHLGDEDEYQPSRRGFVEAFIHGAGGIGQSYRGSCGDAPGNRYFDPVIRHNGQFVKTAGYCTDVFFARATQWIDGVRGKQPFFCYITPNAPHGPLDCPPGSDEPYAGKVPPDVAKFYGMIANIDANVGKLLDQLHAWGLDRETLVIFMTDNGTATGANVFNAGMRGMKVTPYTGGTRVPGFWRWTGTLPAGVDVNALTCHYDVMPTLAELAGVKLDGQLAEQVEGRSLLPLLARSSAAWPDRTFVTHVGRWERGKAAESQHAHASIRDARWQLVFHGREKMELFDLQSDPGEQSNIAAQHPEIVARLSGEFDRWWARVLPKLVNEAAVGPTVNPYKAAYWRQFAGPGPNNVPPPAN